MALAYLAFGMTAASYLAYNFALSKLSAPTNGLLSAAGPGAGAVAAAILFDAKIGDTEALGVALMAAGTAWPALAALRRRARAR